MKEADKTLVAALIQCLRAIDEDSWLHCQATLGDIAMAEERLGNPDEPITVGQLMELAERSKATGRAEGAVDATKRILAFIDDWTQDNLGQ